MFTAVLEEMHTNLYPTQMLYARDEPNAYATPSSHVPTTPSTSTSSPTTSYNNVCLSPSPTSHAYGLPSDANVPTILCSGLLYVSPGPDTSYPFP